MIKGLYAAASAMLAELNQQSILTHNITNMNTPGFKQVLGSLEDFAQTSVVQPPSESSSTQQLNWVGYLGLGVEPSDESTDFTQGTLQSTGQSLDVAIQGEGFFKVQSEDGGVRYTRDGRFIRNAEGALVTVDGLKVLDDGDQPIELTEDGDVTITTSGAIQQNGEDVAQLGLASFENPEQELKRDLSNTFMAEGEPTGETTVVVAQGYLEASNTDAATMITRMMQVARQYEAAQRLVSNQDALLGSAIASLGSS